MSLLQHYILFDLLWFSICVEKTKLLNINMHKMKILTGGGQNAKLFDAISIQGLH
jgi:hypothetical protein